MFNSVPWLFAMAVAFFSLAPVTSCAQGGISIQGTRFIYPQTSRQQSVSISNSSTDESFLVQSWVEDLNGRKSLDFFVTPPLYISSPGNENTLRLIKVSSKQSADRESLYYFVAKAIPSIDDNKKLGVAGTVLRIATATRIKLFIRPVGLTVRPDQAPSALRFYRRSGRLEISNPTPYYITLTGVKVGDESIASLMVAPLTSTWASLSARAGNNIHFSTINDYGAVTSPILRAIE